jgi:uridine monophosphate synthetase
MHEKKTNLSLSADVTTAHELLSLAEQLGPEICVLKTHIDILSDFHPAVINQLMALAKQHHFLIFEDRKFADIGNTVKHQYEGGVYRIADWADIINAHSLPGDGIVAGLASVGQAKQRGLLLLAEMSSLDNLFTPGYTKSTVQMAERFPEFVMGFIAQHRLSPDPRWIYMTPGIQMAAGKDTLGQQYTTPRQAIVEQGSDVIIVGRGIITAADPVAEAKRYRKAGWEAYLEAL